MISSSPTPPSILPVILSKSVMDVINPSKIEEQLLPPKLRLNDDILSVHFNNTTNIKKRHSFSDPNDSLTKYLPLAMEQKPIQVHDDLSSSDAKPTIILDFQTNKSDEEKEHQPQTTIESVISDTDSQGSISEDTESAISFSTFPSDLKSLLKTPATPKNTSRRVIFDPLALLLDAAVIGDLELIIKSAKEVRT
jgi:hypothetical protein